MTFRLLANGTRLSLAATFFAVLLVGCSTAPPRPTPPIAVSTEQTDKPQKTRSPDYYIEKAESAYRRSGDTTLRNQWLLSAAEAFRDQQQCDQSIKLLGVVLPELEDNSQLTQAKLVLAECAISQTPPNYEYVTGMLPALSRQIGFDRRIHYLSAVLNSQQKRWLASAIDWQAADAYGNRYSQEIWQVLQQLDEAELEKARLRESSLQPWVQLSLIVKRFGLQNEQLKTAVAEWQNRFASHPLAIQLPEEVSLAMQQAPLPAQKIAILLPLTGRLASQGLALKEGILAAYMDKRQASNSAPLNELHFFDSALKSGKDMNTMVAGFDLVIGPLTKEAIQALLTELPESKPILALNRLDSQDELTEQPLRPDTYYFSLSPEDEADQLARHLYSRGIRHPVMVASEFDTTQRMAAEFKKRWISLSTAADSTYTPTLASFSNNANMRDGVSELLDVAQSKQRVRQIENMLIPNVHSVPRNRRDIDAIVIFANPEQTELLNPVIESSLSPFARTIPVFASSRSYSLDLSKNSLRDLRNLTFIDMPWMLPNNPWDELTQQSHSLWPQRGDGLLRLFAMSYDAYSLIPQLRRLHTLPQTYLKGLTGTLHISPEGRIQRELSWGKINEDKVMLLVQE